jgi:hypothetical protein
VDTLRRRHIPKHAFYYALNLISLWPRLTRHAAMPDALQVGKVIRFKSEAEDL